MSPAACNLKSDGIPSLSPSFGIGTPNSMTERKPLEEPAANTVENSALNYITT